MELINKLILDLKNDIKQKLKISCIISFVFVIVTIIVRFLGMILLQDVDDKIVFDLITLPIGLIYYSLLLLINYPVIILIGIVEIFIVTFYWYGNN